jgi:hypothetical protein
MKRTNNSVMGRVVMFIIGNQEITINNGLHLGRLAQAGAMDNRKLANVTEVTRNDSPTMQIATVIAMIYLPANLITVCSSSFSSSSQPADTVCSKQICSLSSVQAWQAFSQTNRSLRRHQEYT